MDGDPVQTPHLFRGPDSLRTVLNHQVKTEKNVRSRNEVAVKVLPKLRVSLSSSFTPWVIVNSWHKRKHNTRSITAFFLLSKAGTVFQNLAKSPRNPIQQLERSRRLASLIPSPSSFLFVLFQTHLSFQQNFRC